FLLTAISAYTNVQTMRQYDARIRETHEVLTTLDDLLAATLDAETGQRGFLLTGRSDYLGPYVDAQAKSRVSISRLDELLRDRPLQDESYQGLKQAIAVKFAELSRVIDVRRAQGAESALREVSSDRGKLAMDSIRSQMGALKQEERRERQATVDLLSQATRVAVLSSVATSLIGMVLTIAVFMLVMRTNRSRERQRWLQQAQVELSNAMRGEKSVAQLGNDILRCLAEQTGANAGALYKGEAGVYRLVSTLGVPVDANLPQAFSRGESLLGKVAADGHAMTLGNLPPDFFTIGSALGRSTPGQLVIAPAEAEGVVNAVIELGYFDTMHDRVLELLEQSTTSMGIALRSARFRERLQDALEETQRQAGELQAQSEELRVSNEELEEQGNALKESQARLELQQVELEQTNSQLEEQTLQLQTQRDDLARIAVDLEQKARELEQASQYKSDFLANMSHELRTPLNSLLILSKLLGDNPDANLSPEQVKFARTIESAGNDLLTLINDILDLSKIEAGHVEIEAAPLATERLAINLRKTFEQVAQQRGLVLDIALAPDCPQSIETDRVRLEQVLKNLLSNALKFTERGKVALTISPAPDDMVAFSVSDTGIGIDEDK
ncbi:MAG TPA: CHASE3 domain-containing protein, partial [Burkholderiaceae bacterium]